MDINRVLEEYDSLFGVTEPAQIDHFLMEKIDEAKAEQDDGALLTLMNEQVGFYRDSRQKEKALACCENLKALCRDMGITGTVPYGTTLLNIANAFRVFGNHAEAAACYPEIEEIYQRSLPPDSFDFASLYNNWSLLLMEQGDADGAVSMLEKALAIIDSIPEAVIPQATSRINLACVLIDLSEKENAPERIPKAKSYLSEAIARFEQTGGNDYHYSAALSAMADLKLRENDTVGAAADYERAMAIMKMYMGENPTYQNLVKKRDYALSLAEGAQNGRD